MNLRNIILICVLCLCNVAKAQDTGTSLLEATVYTGLPALTMVTAIWIVPLSKEEHLWNNFTWGFKHAPVWDKNPWYVNYVGHPLVGSEWYLLARNRNYSVLESFIYSTAASVVWEYGVECWIGARPSRQDLLFTSTVGSVLGEVRFYFKNKLMENPDSILNTIGIILLDPINAIYRTVE